MADLVAYTAYMRLARIPNKEFSWGWYELLAPTSATGQNRAMSTQACVCDVTEAFDLSGPTISHHLKVLREAGLIVGDRRGTWIYYRVRPDALRQLSESLLPAAETAVTA